MILARVILSNYNDIQGNYDSLAHKVKHASRSRKSAGKVQYGSSVQTIAGAVRGLYLRFFCSRMFTQLMLERYLSWSIAPR